MEKENKKEFDFVVVKYNEDYYEYIEEIYRLHKDQKRRIFDLACGISTDDDIMDYVEDIISKGDSIVFAVVDKSNNKVAAVVILDEIRMSNDVIVRTNVHLVVGRQYWGKTSRDVLNQFFDKMDREFVKKIVRYEAYIPSNNFGLIKLLKDIGVKCEGTLKRRLAFNNKHGEPTLYDELIFSRVNYGVKLNGKE